MTTASTRCQKPLSARRVARRTIAFSGICTQRRFSCTVSHSSCHEKTSNRYYHRNQQYSVIALTTGSGAIAERYAYSANGEPVFVSASGTVLTDSAKDNRYTYTGREWDEELSLYHFRARMYDAESGRFCGRDPLSYVDSHNIYMFLMSSPLTQLDPTGLTIDFPKAKPREGEDAASTFFNQDCSAFWNNTVSGTEPAKRCWRGFIDATEALPPKERAACRDRVEITCTCKCPDNTSAGHKNGKIFLCSDRPPFLGRDHSGAAQKFCHELQHLLQQAPCTQGGRDPNVPPDCITLLKEEMIAYHCAGECTNPDACALMAGASSSSRCNRDEIVRYIDNRDSVFWRWVQQNLDKFIDKTICRGIVFEPTDAAKQ